MDIQKAQLAWKHILVNKQYSVGDDLLIVFDESKHDLADALAVVACKVGMNPYLLLVPSPSNDVFASWFSNFLRHVVKTQFVFILLSHAMYTAKGIMDVIGRPDQGLGKISQRFFTDWAMPTDSFIRLYSADPAEIGDYRAALYMVLSKGRSIRLTTQLGTDLQLQPRGWRSDSEYDMGEIYTAPLETSAEGVLIYDASMFWGQPDSPIKVTVNGGRINKIECLGPPARQYQDFVTQSKKDNGASVLGELGIGLNPQADPFSNGMEAEQARDTCHIDFGNNIPFGGSNRSSVHFGGTIYRPTIYVDGIMVVDKGYLIK